LLFSPVSFVRGKAAELSLESLQQRDFMFVREGLDILKLQ